MTKPLMVLKTELIDILNHGAGYSRRLGRFIYEREGPFEIIPLDFGKKPLSAAQLVRRALGVEDQPKRQPTVAEMDEMINRSKQLYPEPLIDQLFPGAEVSHDPKPAPKPEPKPEISEAMLNRIEKSLNEFDSVMADYWKSEVKARAELETRDDPRQSPRPHVIEVRPNVTVNLPEGLINPQLMVPEHEITQIVERDEEGMIKTIHKRVNPPEAEAAEPKRKSIREYIRGQLGLE